jgi:Glycosyl hydrolases family 25
MTGRIIDVSSNNHGPDDGTPINWEAVKAAGVTTVIIKATQGVSYTNPWFHTDLAGAIGQGLDVMAYHFFDYGVGNSPEAEAAHFLSVAGHLAQCLDIETSENVQWARTFLQELSRPADELLVYGSASTLRSVYAQLPAMPWPAAYGQLYPGWGVLWQFTDSAAIAGIPVSNTDESRWYGSEIQYDTLFAKYAEPTGELEMLAPTPDGGGYWIVNAAGAVITRGNAQYLGGPNTSNTAPSGKPPVWNGKPDLIAGHVVTSITAHPTQQGYWIEDNVGNIYAYGAAENFPA